MFFSFVVAACYIIAIVFIICHINVHSFYFLIVIHVGGCGVLLVVATHHCQATPSPFSSSYSLGHYHYEILLLLQPIVAHRHPHDLIILCL
jgi:hypothetical protein